MLGGDLSVGPAPAVARLALPKIDPPEVSLEQVGPDRFKLRCQSGLNAPHRVLAGLVTAMADDYGALCVKHAEPPI